jgi:hypothetical protein
MVRQSEPSLLTRRFRHIRPDLDRLIVGTLACISAFGRRVAARTGPLVIWKSYGQLEFIPSSSPLLARRTGRDSRNPLASPFLQPYIEVNSRSDRSAS